MKIPSHFQPSGDPPDETAGPSEVKQTPLLPDGPKKEFREMKNPKPWVIARKKRTREPLWEEVGRNRPGSLSPAVEERRRLILASQLSPSRTVVRLPDSNQIVFFCPVCQEQTQSEDTELGKERVCPKCGAEFKLPDPDSDGLIVLLRVDARRAQTEALPPAVLPEERGADGRSNEALFQSVEDLLPEGNEMVLEWGLEKFETKPESAKFKRLWLWVAMIVFLCAGGFLVRHVQQSSARTILGAAAPGASIRADGEGLDWANIPAGTVFLMADTVIRSYFSAPDLAAKAAVSRGGEGALARMQAYYGKNGGYEAETRANGDVRSIQILEERELGGQKFLVVRVGFERGNTGILVLLKAKEHFEVDWDYAVGYGEMDFEALMDERPTRPVLLRAYLREAHDFHDGFANTEFRSFVLRDPARALFVPIYVARGSAAETKLLESWANSNYPPIEDGRRKQLDVHFILKVRYEDSGGRRGFLIDEVLTRGWILPDSTQ